MGLREELGRASVLLQGAIGGGVSAGFWEESDGVGCLWLGNEVFGIFGVWVSW